MKYKCQCPCGCKYETVHKEQIHKHHIQAKSRGGKNNKDNLTEHTFEFLRILDSTAGKCLEYRDFTGNVDYYFINRIT